VKNQNQLKSKTDLNSVKGFAEWKIANPWSRLAAQVIDQGLVSFAVISAMAIWFPQKIGSAHWFVTLVLMWILVSTLTQGIFAFFYRNTPGKKSMGLELKSALPHHELTFSQSLVRSFTWWLGALTLGAGWSTILSRPDRRSWHDVAADTIVVSRTAEPRYPTLFQKRFGEVWLALLSFAFAFCIVGLLLVEMQGLETNKSPGSKHFDDLSTLNQNSWLIVAGQTFHPLPSGLLVGEDAKLAKLLSLFSQGKQLPLGERYNFYKVNMEEIEDELCRVGHEKLQPCDSARLMVELLTPTPGKTSYPQALQGLLVLQEVETLKTAKDQIRYLDKAIKEATLFSPQYLALKTLEAKIFGKTGDFKKAKAVAEEDLNKVDMVQADKSFAQVFVNSACQMSALEDCGFQAKSVCLKKDFWKNWSKGCSAKSDGELKTAPELLGYWWGKSKTPEIKNMNYKDWEREKNDFQNQSADATYVSFQRDIFTALDFIVNLKTAPKDVFARSKKISPENPLWGWSHKQALSELGTQWSAIIYPIELKLLGRYGILDNQKGRTIASEGGSEESKPRLTPQLTIER
jgi:uncharacterized RDD family membrane protein YckC